MWLAPKTTAAGRKQTKHRTSKLQASSAISVRMEKKIDKAHCLKGDMWCLRTLSRKKKSRKGGYFRWPPCCKELSDLLGHWYILQLCWLPPVLQYYTFLSVLFLPASQEFIHQASSEVTSTHHTKVRRGLATAEWTPPLVPLCRCSGRSLCSRCCTPAFSFRMQTYVLHNVMVERVPKY